MSETTPQDAPNPPEVRGAAIMISYKELVEIRAYMASIGSKLDAALALKGTVENHSQRIAALETAVAVRSASSRVWNSIAIFVGGVVTAALGGGALQILPKLWGG